MDKCSYKVTKVCVHTHLPKPVRIRCKKKVGVKVYIYAFLRFYPKIVYLFAKISFFLSQKVKLGFVS